MSSLEMKKGFILITTDMESELQRLKEELSPKRVVGFLQEEFKLEHAKAVTAESYISESETKYIVLGARSFHPVSQNSLLKLLEEPPRNIEYIVLSPSKSNLLATVRSRLPLFKGKKQRILPPVEITLGKIDYKEVFTFLKEHARIKKGEAKLLVEALYRKAAVEEKLSLTQSQLENFDKAYRLLELNAKAQSVLAMLLMGFSGEKNAS